MALEHTGIASVHSGTCIDPLKPPVSWWPGEGEGFVDDGEGLNGDPHVHGEGFNDVVNDVVGENHIVRHGGVEFVPGVVGQGFRFNVRLGQPFMEINDAMNLQPATFTVDLWAQRFSLGQNNGDSNLLVLKAITDIVDTGVSYFISWNNAHKIVAQLFFEDNDPPVELTSITVHPFDPEPSVVHVALTYDGTTVTLYVNGAVEDSEDAPGRSVAYGPGSMVVGAIHNVELLRNRHPRSPDGIIDELEIFDYALTGDQIYAIWDTEGECKVPEEPSPEVDVDIKPGSDATNPINLGAGSGKNGKGKGNANIPVAILTTDDFDATTVEVSTVTLGDDDADVVLVTLKKNSTPQAALEDVDHDGDTDLLMHFSIAELVGNNDLDEFTEVLCVNGFTEGGDAIHGCDDVTIVGGRPAAAGRSSR